MLMYQHEERRTINAPAEEIFATLSDVAHHVELAGSGEVQSIRVLTDGPVGLGTEWEADERIPFGKKIEEFTAHSKVTAFAPPYKLAWTSEPPGKPKPKRIEWTYDLAPAPGGGTQVTERVEVDMGAMGLLMRLPYKRMRGNAVAEGMRKTLANLEARAGR